jgi:hypothetical protein
MGSAVSLASLLRSRSSPGTEAKFPSPPQTKLPVMKYRFLAVSGRQPINCSTFSPRCKKRRSRCCCIHNPGLTEPVLPRRSSSMRSPHGQRAKRDNSSQFDTVIFRLFCRRRQPWMRASMNSSLPIPPDLESLGERADPRWGTSSVLFDRGSCGRSFAND